MQGSGIQSIEIVLLLLLLFVAGFTALARKLQTPYPIVLVLAGLVVEPRAGYSTGHARSRSYFSSGVAAAAFFRCMAYFMA